jgi:glycine reductase
MVKAIEATGIAVVHICTIVPISQTVGANRIVPAVAIPYPLGDPSKTLEEERVIRRAILEKSLEALKTPIKEQTVFN